MRQISHHGYEEFFYPLIHPWKHYVPFRCSVTACPISTIVDYLRKNDDLAKRIGEQGAKFSYTHLSSKGRACYYRVLLHEMAKLYADDFAVDWNLLVTPTLLLARSK